MKHDGRDSKDNDNLHLMGLLSWRERYQLGSADAPSGPEWRQFREAVAERDQKRRPHTQSDLMGYTPGETLSMFHEPEIGNWHKEMQEFRIPDECNTVVFVPCAATKPWADAKRGLYKSYNQLQAERDGGDLPNFYFVTISEPLGVVPESRWADFPPYENPGLFKDRYLRTGMTTKEQAEFFGRKVVLPYDTVQYDMAIDRLAQVISGFVATNVQEGREFLSFVEDFSGKSTHSDMLDMASRSLDFLPEENRFHKRGKPRESPDILIREVLSKRA